jgi:hypothetical protein
MNQSPKKSSGSTDYYLYLRPNLIIPLSDKQTVSIEDLDLAEQVARASNQAIGRATLDPVYFSDEFNWQPPPQLVEQPVERPAPRTARVKKVLKRFVASPIFEFIVFITPKPFKTMLQWLQERLKEPSTYQGLTVVAGALGYALEPQAIEAIGVAVAAVLGAILVIKREGLIQKVEDAQ